MSDKNKASSTKRMDGRSTNQSGKQSASSGSRGGTSEQHAKAGRQSHKND